MRVLDAFPGGAVRGGDLIDGMSTPNREYEPIHQDRWGTAYRPERVLALGVMLEDLDKVEGEVCFLESTVRSMGHVMGLVPIERLNLTLNALADAHARIEKLEGDLAELTVVDTVVAQAVEKALADLAPQLVGLVDDAQQASAPVAAPPPSDKELAAASRRRK